MFRRTPGSQSDIFNNIGNHLSERKARMLDDPAGWHNTFYTDIVSRIDEDIFSVLFDNKMGRPNASVQDLIGMIILKEGNGWSDEQLFEECRFNLLVMRALGKANIDEDIPVEATYYDFRRRLHEHNEAHGEDLFKKVFQDVTIKQMKKYGVQGKKIRMDSKLINSNIAQSGRLELIVEVIRKFIKELEIWPLESVVKPEVYQLLKALKEKTTCNILYPMTSAEKKKLLHDLGPAIKGILEYYEDRFMEVEHRSVLRRVFEEQYTDKSPSDQSATDRGESSRKVKTGEPKAEKTADESLNEDDKGLQSQQKKSKKSTQTQEEHSVKDDQDRPASPGQPSARRQPATESEQRESEGNSEIEPKDKKDIESSSVQSVHDPEATYRTKGNSNNKQTVSGYHGNITEVCDDPSGLNLIIDGELKTANESEDSFFLNSVSECEKMIEDVQGNENHIEDVITDGGYDSIENRKEMVRPERPTWRLAKMKGQTLSFYMEIDDEDNLHVWESCSRQKCEVSKSRNGKKIVIKTPVGKVRYFTREEIVGYIIKLKIQSNQNKDSYNLRANVESTINQVFHRLGKSKKIKYRGYQACNTYMFSRMFWANHRRITRKITEEVLQTLKNGQNELESLKNGLESLENFLWSMVDNVISLKKYIKTYISIIIFSPQSL